MSKQIILALILLSSALIAKSAILSDTAFVHQDICFNDSLLVHDTWFSAQNLAGIVAIPNGAADGTDSIISVDLSLSTSNVLIYRDTFCASQTILLFGNLFSPNQTSKTINPGIIATNGCDSIIEVDLVFGMPSSHLIEATVCPGDTIEVNGVNYHNGFFIGNETIEGGSFSGCDSTIEINLTPLLNGTFVWQETLYEDESKTINGDVFDATTPSGNIVLPNMAENGCDSIVEVDLNFIPRPQQFAYLPNVFEPEAVNPLNQVFQPGLRPEVTGIVEMHIFDRWGDLIYFSADGQNMVWDGLYKNKKAPVGTYFVTVLLALEDGQMVQEEGLVTLIR